MNKPNDIKNSGRVVFNDNLINDLTYRLKDLYKVNEVRCSDLSYGLRLDIIGSDSFKFIRDSVVRISKIPSDSLLEFGRDVDNKQLSLVYFPEKDRQLVKILSKRNKNTI